MALEETTTLEFAARTLIPRTPATAAEEFETEAGLLFNEAGAGLSVAQAVAGEGTATAAAMGFPTNEEAVGFDEPVKCPRNKFENSSRSLPPQGGCSGKSGLYLYRESGSS